MWFLCHKTNSGQTKWKRRSRSFQKCMTCGGGEVFFHWYSLSKSSNKDFKYFQIWEYFCDFHIRRPIQHGPGERGDQDVSEYLWHIGVRSYFSTDIGCQSWVTYISNLFRFGHILLIFQVLPQDQPGRPETNRTSKQP